MRTLEELEVLVIDCQATHPDPRKGSLLELGWAAVRTCDALSPEKAGITSQVIEGAMTHLPRHVQRVTGLQADDFLEAVQEEVAWHSLQREAIRLAHWHSAPQCPTVIHFARYEETYLEALHRKYSPESSFPFEVICTHDIARRLHAGLPRRGLRAVAGFYGHSVPPSRRAAHHVEATLFVWFHLVRDLQKLGVQTQADLAGFLAETEPVNRAGRLYPMESRLRRRLPDAPGVYRMLRSNSDVLYVGKALSLRRRVNSYFQKRSGHSDHILEMLAQARDLQFDPTSSALEAALLESDQIKALDPPYNVALRRGDRSLVFFSKDLSTHSRECKPECPLGPVPANPYSLSLPSFLRWFGTGSRESLSVFMSHWEEFRAHLRLEEETLVAARRLLLSRFEPWLQESSNSRRLLRLTSILWLQKLSAAEEEEAVALSDDNDKDATKRAAKTDWNPEQTASWMESLLLQTGMAVRKARWLRTLSNSSLGWSRGDSRGRAVLLEAGRITRSRDWKVGESLEPAPNAQGVPPIMDIATYDRLTVLNSELKRLIRTGGSVQLHLGGRVALDSQALEKVLKWV